MARSLVVGVLFCLFFALEARAEWKGSANVDLTATGMYWPEGTLAPDMHRYRDVYVLKIPATLKNGRSFRIRFQPLLQADPNNPSTVDPQHPDRNERYYWDIQEGYVQIQSLPWTLQVGMNVQTWGDTDVFNPLDVVSARRFYDPMMSEKLGAPTVLLKREWEKVFVEAVYIPRQAQTLLPGENSRWLPRDVYASRAFTGASDGSGGTFSGTINLPSTLRYHYQQLGVMTAAMNDNFGARIKFRLPGFDWTVAGFQGAAATPAVNIVGLSIVTGTLKPGTQNADIFVNPDVNLQALYYKSRMLGTSFVYVLGDFLLKGATAKNQVVSSLAGATNGGQSIESRLPKDDWENVLGLERTFAVGPGQLTVLAQGTYVQHNEGLDTNSVSLARMFDRAAMVGLRWAPGEKWTVLGSGLVDIQYHGSLEHLEANYKIADGWSTRLSGDRLDGRAETPIGTYKKNDRVMLSLNIQK